MGGVDDILFWKNKKNKQTTTTTTKKTGIFKAFTSGNSEKLCVAPLENSKVKNEDPWKPHMSFSWSWTPLEMLLLF